MPTITKTTTLQLLECPNCEAYIALTEQRLRLLREGGINFWCPNGHSLSWPVGGSEEIKQRTRAEAAEAETRRLAAERDGLLAEIGLQTKAIKRMTRRANAGVCLHCHRTFQNVARHQASQHPTGSPEYPGAAKWQTPTPK